MLRSQEIFQVDPRQPLELYVNDLYQYDLNDLDNDEDEASSQEDSSDEDEIAALKKQDPYLVRAFCLTADHQSVSVDIHGFCPYFYVKIPEDWTNASLVKFVEHLKRQVYYQSRDGLLDYRVMLAKPFSHFTGEDKFKYCRLTFQNLKAFRRKPVNADARPQHGIRPSLAHCAQMKTVRRRPSSSLIQLGVHDGCAAGSRPDRS